MRTVNTPVVEHRARVDPNSPLFTSDWALEGARITGHIAWSTCQSERTWRTEVRETVHQRPNTAAALVLIGGGLALGVVGAATYDTSDPKLSCTDSFDGGGTIVVSNDSVCTWHEPENLTATAFAITGMLSVAVGTMVLAVTASDTTKTLNSTPHSETSTLPCVAPSDLSILSLVLKVGEGKFLHVALDPSGDASIEIPKGAHLPPDTDLPIVVYRVPPGATGVLRRWQVIGTVHTPAPE